MRAFLAAAGFAAGLAAMPAFDYARAGAVGYIAPLVQTNVVAVRACAPVAVDIYFDRGRAELSPSAAATLNMVSERVRGCPIEAVSIEAQPDAVADGPGRKLAGLRGAAVLKELSARGVAPDAIVIAQAQTGEPASADPAPEHLRLSIAPRENPVRPGVEAKTAAAPSVPRNEI